MNYDNELEEIGAQIYKVGGCVRDELMGVDSKDIDCVVVGATEQDMLNLGFEPVGKDFPVFLHPVTKWEYALARTERKTSAGYNGFSVETKNVSLEEDLMRRDLTINAMALDKEGNLIDPYHGKKDLDAKILRHVGIHFKEDPVRILRIARFSARYNFTIAPATMLFMKEMVDNGEFDHLTAERVWKEFEKVLPEKYLSNFFNILDQIGALKKIPGFHSIEDKDFFTAIRNSFPFETVFKEHSFNLEIMKESFRPSSQEHIFNLSLLHVFSQMDKTDLKKWTMPANEQQKIVQFSIWKNADNFYSYMNTDEKINFIQQNKALHFPQQAAFLLNDVLIYQAWKKDISLDYENEVHQLNKDIQFLKVLDYPAIVKEALTNKIRPDMAVKTAQIELLDKIKPKLKMK